MVPAEGEGGWEGGFGWDPPPPRVPLWSPPKPAQNFFILNLRGTEGTETKIWLSASNIGRGGGGSRGGGGGGLPPAVCGRSNTSLGGGGFGTRPRSLGGGGYKCNLHHEFDTTQLRMPLTAVQRSRGLLALPRVLWCHAAQHCSALRSCCTGAGHRALCCPLRDTIALLLCGPCG